MSHDDGRLASRWCFECGDYRPNTSHPHGAVEPVGEPTLFDEGLDLHSGRIRTPDHSTSKAGARAVAYRAGSQKARLLDAYRGFPRDGLTDEEAAEVAGLRLKPSCCWWKRCNELRQDGRIEPTGAERMGTAGSPRMVCRIVQRGES